MLSESFGVDMNELFEEFETEPVSSGTVAQVYRAVLKPEHAFTDNSGKLITEVAVKVRHPAAVAEQLLKCKHLYRATEKLPEGEALNVVSNAADKMDLKQGAVEYFLA